MSKYHVSQHIELDTNFATSKRKDIATYEIMHKDKVVASVSTKGYATVFDEQFMPFDLVLEEDHDFDSLFNNLVNFQHWCASRVLTLDRKYAKEILNSIGAAQATTDTDRANISLSYHCVSLTDVYWVRELGSSATFAQLNLYDNSLNEALVELSLRGKPMTVTNHELAQDLSTRGCFAKAWIRTQEGFKLLKDGGADIVRREILASEICQCFDIPQIHYRLHEYNGESVSESNIVTSKDRSIVSKMAFEIYCINHDLDVIEACIRLDAITYYGMNILDYLIGNTDRHAENWGVLVDNTTNKPLSLYPLMDFNQSFLAYETIDGAMCLTTPRSMSQKDAAIEAVKKIGLRQIREMDLSKFGDMIPEAEMFQKRLALLKEYDK